MIELFSIVFGRNIVRVTQLNAFWVPLEWTVRHLNKPWCAFQPGPKPEHSPYFLHSHCSTHNCETSLPENRFIIQVSTSKVPPLRHTSTNYISTTWIRTTFPNSAHSGKAKINISSSQVTALKQRRGRPISLSPAPEKKVCSTVRTPHAYTLRKLGWRRR